MTTYRLLRLGLVVALIVLVIGVIAAKLNVNGGFEIISAAILAIAALMTAIARKVSTKSPSRQVPNR
jgi:hypothetical protein